MDGKDVTEVLAELNLAKPSLNPARARSIYGTYLRAKQRQDLNVIFTNTDGPLKPGILIPTHEGMWDPFLISCAIYEARGIKEEDITEETLSFRFPMDKAWWNPGFARAGIKFSQFITKTYNRFSKTEKTKLSQFLHHLPEHAQALFPSYWVAPLGAYAVEKGKTIQESTKNIAVGLEEIIFAEGEVNRPRAWYTTDDTVHKAHTGSVWIAGRAQVYKDYLRLAYEHGGDDELIRAALNIGITAERLSHLYKHKESLHEEVSLRAANVSFYPIFQVPEHAAMHFLTKIQAAKLPKIIKRSARGLLQTAAWLAPRMKFLELIVHGYTLYDSKPTLSITIAPPLSVRELLGYEYTHQLEQTKPADYATLLQAPMLTGSQEMKQNVRAFTNFLMGQAYSNMTLSMDNAAVMALERLANQKRTRITIKDFYTEVGSAAKMIIKSGIRHLSHLEEELEQLESGHYAPEAKRAFEHLQYFGILQRDKENLKLNVRKLRYIPKNQSAVRLLNPTRVAYNEIRFFPDLYNYCRG